MSRLRRAAAILALSLAACAPRGMPPSAERPAAPEGFPLGEYREAQAAGKALYRIDPARSLVAIEVRRAGALASFGHDHVIAGHDLAGYALPGEGRADLYLRLDRLRVDEPALRAEAGFDTRPSDADIAGTRDNMLAVLDAARYPFVSIRISARPAGPARLDITLRGETRAFEIPLRLARSEDRLEASGALSFNQTDFGIRPFSVLGGALQVRDRLDLRFRVVAGRAGAF